jgi:hypothetical protein
MNEASRRDFLGTAGAVLGAGGKGVRTLLCEAPVGPCRQKGPDPFSTSPPGIPPHRSISLEGIHAYTDKVSVAAGEPICFHLSSTHPYELEVCRLGIGVDDPGSDEVLHSFKVTQPVAQPIHPGSYLHIPNALNPDLEMRALTLEIWVRRWRTRGRQALFTQYDEPGSCGFGIFVNDDGSLSVYLGSGGKVIERAIYRSAPSLLKMVVNPRGLEPATDNTPSVVQENRWHHVAVSYESGSAGLWLDGENTGRWDAAAFIRAGNAPLRIGAAGREGRSDFLLDADIALPVLYSRALSPDEIRARFEQKGLRPAAGAGVVGCWPLAEERGEACADTSDHGRHGRIINHGTWMIGGPSFDAAISRFGAYEPGRDARRGHGLRLASDDLYDCRWQPTHEYRIPESALPGTYAGRIRFSLYGQPRIYHTLFVVKRAAGALPAPIVFLCSTNTWRAYAATPFSPTWPGVKKSIGNNGFANSPGDPPPPAFCLYRPHQAGQGTYHAGCRMPWPVAGPYTLIGPEEWDNSHLCRAERFTQAWLDTEGYNYDAISDTDLHRDPALLKGHKVLFVAGHSEYWSKDAMRAVDGFLSAGGSAVVLSGNTAFWRVSFNDDGSILECRKADAPGSQVPVNRRGEIWHSDDGQRGGMARECGYPAWRLLGLEYMSLVGVGAVGLGPYRVRNAGHFLFHQPIELGLNDADTFGKETGKALPQPIGHEADVRVSTLARFMVEPAPPGGAQPEVDPRGITLLAEGIADWNRVNIGAPYDYFQRPVARDRCPPISVAAEMIYWERPGGGRVFHAGSINAGWTLAVDPKWSGLLKNVLHHLGVEIPLQEVKQTPRKASKGRSR